MMRCACLVKVEDSRILLVRVRENRHWYLPGGKIEEGETPEQTLSRELAEELGIAVIQDSLTFLCTVVGPAYGISDEVELVCFSASWTGELEPKEEVSEVDWIGIHEKERLAPAVILLVDRYLKAGKIPAVRPTTSLIVLVPGTGGGGA